MAGVARWCVLLWGLVVAAEASGQVFTVRSVAGEELRLLDVRLEEDRIAGRRPDGTELASLSLCDVLWMEPGGAGDAAAPPPAAPGISVAVRLRDGSTLFGRLLEGEEDELRWRHDSLGDLSVLVDYVEAVAFAEGGAVPDVSAVPPATEEDVVWKGGDLEGDRVEGTVVRMGPRGIVVETDLGRITVPVAEVRAIALASVGPVDLLFGDGPEVRAVFQDGSRLRGRIVEFADQGVRMRRLDGEELLVPPSGLLRLVFAPRGSVWLPDLVPDEVESYPFIGGPEDFLFPYRTDVSFDGGLLRVAGEPFARGLALHSYTRLRWSLNGRFARLKARVGISDEALGVKLPVAADFVVLTDGREALRLSGLSPGERARAVDLDLTGVGVLEFVADFGGQGDVGDRIVVGDPLLLEAR